MNSRKRDIVFEAKTEEPAVKPIPYKDVRQALTHRDWILDRLPHLADREFSTVVVTQQFSLSNVAGGTVGDVFVAQPKTLVDLFDQASTVLGTIRDQARALASQELGDLVIQQFDEAGLDSASILLKLTSTRLDSLPRRD